MKTFMAVLCLVLVLPLLSVLADDRADHIMVSSSGTSTQMLLVDGPATVLPIPPPIPGLVIESCDSEHVVVSGLLEDCFKLLTTTKGSTKAKALRTITCCKTDDCPNRP